jgi:DNA-binding response OmpR family regulator
MPFAVWVTASGLDLYKELCRVNPSYRQRVVFITGDTSNSDTIRFLKAEGLRYFSKPIDLQAIQALIVDVPPETT